MSRQSSIRAKLLAKVFNRNTIGMSITLKTQSAPQYNDRGEIEDTTSTESTVVGVPYNIIDRNQSYEKFGQLLEGEMDVALPWDTVININDLLTIASEDWKVVNVEKNYLPENVVTIVRVVRQQN